MKYDEGKLWAAVITRAIQDIAGKNLKLKKEACQWIRSRSFETVCELANFDFKHLKNMLNKIIGKGDSMAQNIKSLLINNINECVTYLLPSGKFYQDKLYIGKLGEDEIIVEIEGEKIGNWQNISKNKSGDILELWILITKNIHSAERWLSAKDEKSSTLEEKQEKAFSVKHYLNDKSPMPQDIIGPRILTPGGLLVIGGTPKIGKSNFLLSLLVHLAAGVSFLGMKPIKPLKIFYLQNEMEYDYIRERIQKTKINHKLLDLVNENLVITKKVKLTLNSDNVEKVKEFMSENLDVKTVDLIVIDSLFDYKNMIPFLQNGINKLRSITNPMAGVILTHYTKKVSTTTLKKNPFQALSGANVLRSLYTSGVVMFKPNQNRNVLQVTYELRNGKPIPTKYINEANGHWKISTSA